MKNGQNFAGWWYMTGKYLHRDIYKGIKNLIKWFPIVWKDADWDHAYIMYALRFKIKNTADYIEKHNRYEGCERDVERMRLCVKLMDNIENDVYELEYQDYQETNFHFEKNKNNLNELKEDIIRDDTKQYIEKYPNDYRRLLDKENLSDIRIALMLGHNRHNRATKLLFTLIERNIYLWWD